MFAVSAEQGSVPGELVGQLMSSIRMGRSRVSASVIVDASLGISTCRTTSQAGLA